VEGINQIRLIARHIVVTSRERNLSLHSSDSQFLVALNAHNASQFYIYIFFFIFHIFRYAAIELTVPSSALSCASVLKIPIFQLAFVLNWNLLMYVLRLRIKIITFLWLI
jgi:hypothetical protein